MLHNLHLDNKRFIVNLSISFNLIIHDTLWYIYFYVLHYLFWFSIDIIFDNTINLNRVIKLRPGTIRVLQFEKQPRQEQPEPEQHQQQQQQQQQQKEEQPEPYEQQLQQAEQEELEHQQGEQEMEIDPFANIDLPFTKGILIRKNLNNFYTTLTSKS